MCLHIFSKLIVILFSRPICYKFKLKNYALLFLLWQYFFHDFIDEKEFLLVAYFINYFTTLYALISRLLYVKCFLLVLIGIWIFFSVLNTTRLNDFSNCHLANSPYHFELALFNYTHANDNKFSLRAIKNKDLFLLFCRTFLIESCRKMFRSLDYDHCVSRRPRGHGKMDRFKHLWMVESFVSNVRAVYRLRIYYFALSPSSRTPPFLAWFIDRCTTLEATSRESSRHVVRIQACITKWNARCTSESRYKDFLSVVSSIQCTILKPSACLPRSAAPPSRGQSRGIPEGIHHERWYLAIYLSVVSQCRRISFFFFF